MLGMRNHKGNYCRITIRFYPCVQLQQTNNYSFSANVLFVGKKHIAMCEESNSKQMTANQPNCHQ